MVSLLGAAVPFIGIGEFLTGSDESFIPDLQSIVVGASAIALAVGGAWGATHYIRERAVRLARQHSLEEVEERAYYQAYGAEKGKQEAR